MFAFDAGLCQTERRLLSFYKRRRIKKKNIKPSSAAYHYIFTFHRTQQVGRRRHLRAAERLLSTGVRGRKDATQSVIAENKTGATRKKGRESGAASSENDGEEERGEEQGTLRGEKSEAPTDGK